MITSLTSFQRALLKWYDHARRDLPWRLIPPGASHPNPYHVLLSETMLQQTQVATVIPYFTRFIQQFPTLADLASADEQAVLRLWQGLGYYSRAANLHEAARQIITHHDGLIPRDLNALRQLPGVGRYTAGAIASIAFGRRAPILDGNVTRVLCRLDAIRSDPRDKSTQALLWQRADQILPARRIGDFNSALMELGATICTPRNPQCPLCPVRSSCNAYQMGLQSQIPPPKRRTPAPDVRRWTYCIEKDGRWLIQRRPKKGRWAGLWQFITLDAPADHGIIEIPPLKLKVAPIHKIGRLRHALTHRTYEFTAHRCRLIGRLPRSSAHLAWIPLDQIDHYPLSRPQLQIAHLLTRP